MKSMTARLLVYLVYFVLGNAIAFALALAGLLWRLHHPIAVATFGLALFAVAFVVARIATRPVRDLANAATWLQVDIESDYPSILAFSVQATSGSNMVAAPAPAQP